jgi:hypothetical protein
MFYENLKSYDSYQPEESANNPALVKQLFNNSKFSYFLAAF